MNDGKKKLITGVMKKVVLFFVLISGLSFGLQAQNPIRVGGRQLDLGVSSVEYGYPISVAMDFGIHEDFSVGVQASWCGFTETWDSADYHRNIVGLKAFGNYHFNRILKMSDKWDFYTGLNVGVYFWSKPPDYYGDNTTGTGLGLQVGGRYYFTDKFGLNLEFGTGNDTSGVKFGISWMFKNP